MPHEIIAGTVAPRRIAGRRPGDTVGGPSVPPCPPPGPGAAGILDRSYHVVRAFPVLDTPPS